MITIEDINKCKTYLSSKYADAPEDAITSVTYDSSKSNILFIECLFYGNYNYDKQYEFCELS